MVMNGEPDMMTSHYSGEPSMMRSKNEYKIEADQKKQLTPLGKIMKHEGFRLDPYQDSKGYLTGGTGHKMSGKDIKDFSQLGSDDEKYQFWTDKFEEDHTKASTGAVRIMNNRGIEDNPVVEGVLVNMIFNMGEAGVNNFDNFLTALSNKDMDKAIYEMKHDSDGGKSSYYEDVGSRVDDLADELKGLK